MWKMGDLRLSRSVQRTYIGRRSGCSQPVIIALLVFSAFIFIIFQLGSLIPHKAAPLTFAWTSSAVRDIAVYIKPNQHTTLLQPSNLCEDPPFILVVVPSSINNTLQRDTIRRTWGQWAGSNLDAILANDLTAAQKVSKETDKKPPNVLKAYNPLVKRAKLVFLLGTRHEEKPISSFVKEESRMFGDMVVEDFIDSYTNLTLKTVFMLKWVKQHCSKAHYVMKVDDDIFLNIPNLQQMLLNKTIVSTSFLAGNLICGAKPIHNQWSKWYTPRYMFRSNQYPNYLSGTGYVMSINLIEPLLNAAISTPYFHLEDVFLTGICAKKIGVKPTDQVGFSYQRRAVNACIYREVIMGHEVLPLDMVRLWNMLNQPQVIAKCRPMKKSQLRSYFPKCTWR